MKKLLFVTVLIFSLLITTQTAYAYWEDSDQVVIDESNQLYVIEETLSNSGLKLIPINAILKPGDTHEVFYTYSITVEESVDFDYGVENIKILNSTGKSVSLDDYFEFETTIDHYEKVRISNNLFGDDIYGYQYQISVKITMTHDDGTIDYRPIYGQQIGFSFFLRVSKP